jgi:hypothetical protein
LERDFNTAGHTFPLYCRNRMVEMPETLEVRRFDNSGMNTLISIKRHVQGAGKRDKHAHFPFASRSQDS